MPAKKTPRGKEQMQRFENLLQRLFTVAKDDVDKAEKMADEIEEVIERHEEPTADE